MSANNQLVIQKYKKGWMVSEIDIEGSGGYFLQDKPIKTLEQAVAIANKYMKTNIVEYGLRIEGL